MIVVCLPTYNESANIERMLRAIESVFLDAGLTGRVLVIDDASPDGTGDIAERVARELSRVRVLHRVEKQGLGPAYLDGFRQALAEGAELVLEMDCDFSHDPADIPRLVAATQNADLVIGSRYAGGRVENWGVLRRAISRSGSLYAQAVLGLPLHDLTSGFKCYRRDVLEGVGLERISSKGYAFQIETTYRAVRAGFRVVEVPIVFTDREAGSSKMSGGIVAEAIWRVPAIRVAALRGRL